MKLLKIIIIMAMHSLSLDVYAVEKLFVVRITDLGPEPNPSPFTEISHLVRREHGSLYSDRTGFVADEILEGRNYGIRSPRFDIATLPAITGQFLYAESDWIADSKSPRRLSSFARSRQTYFDMDGLPWVIVNIAVKRPNVNVGLVDASASETTGDTGQFLINFQAPARSNTRIKFKLSGNAVKGKDYESIPNSIVIPAGNTQGIIEIIPINDAEKEGVEKVIIKLDASSVQRYKLKGPKKATITITDDD